MLATRNLGKIHEIKNMLRGMPIKILTYDGFADLKEVREDGKTLKENAIKKAVAVARHTGFVSLADDSGLFVNALNGAPGVTSARFAGEHCSYEDNNRKLLKMLGEYPPSKRGARFCCVLALAVPGGRIKTVQGVLKGWIGFELKGRHGFGYDPVFVVPSYEQTLAQLGLKIKNKISHRSLALEKAKPLIKKLLMGIL